MQLPPYIPAWPDLRPFVADVWLIVTAIAVLIVPFFVRRPNAAVGVITVAGLTTALLSLIAVGPADAGRFAPMLAADGVALAWKSILLLFTIGVVLLWFATTRHQTPQGEGPEFFLLLVCATLGMSLMGSAANLLMLFIAVELASLPSYVLAGFGKTDRIGAEASLKYVLFGAAASGVMVWGLSLLYGVCGTLNLYNTVAADGAIVAGVAEQVFRQGGATPLVLIGLLALLVGLAFKVAAVPFHLWCPDVFEGAGVDVTAFLSVASKGAGLVLLLRVAVALAEPAGFAPTTPTVVLAWIIGVMGVLTCTVGNTAAYVQTNLKRLLAYSSIAHAGYMLCVIALIVAGRSTGVGPLMEMSQALLFYLAVYLFMNLGAFAVVAVVGRQSGQTLDHFSGLGRRSPLLAACMTLCCFSLIGVPPLAGFTAKFNLMQVLGSAGGWWWVLVAAIAVNTLLSVYYYFRVIRVMYLQDAGAPRLQTNRLGTGLAVASAAMLLAMFVGANALTRWTDRFAGFRHSTMLAPVGSNLADANAP